MIDSRLELLIAKDAIRDAMYRYCRSMDRMDIELGLSVFHSDAPADYGAIYQGDGYGFVRFAYDSHAKMISHQHQLGNLLIRVDGDKAWSEAYVTIAFRLRDATGQLLAMETRGRYIDHWEKRDGRWAISDRRYIHAMDEVWPTADDAFGNDGTRDSHDPSYELGL